jgi:SAM-dependent MidA family methyltransferase
MSLSEIIISRIKKEGPISFHDFMDMALYYPACGYYNSKSEKIGKHGDFYTSPYFTSVFGHVIAKQLEEMWGALNKEPFTIVEYGAGTGLLCNDILNHLENNDELYNNLSYCIIEKSEVMRLRQQEILNEKVQWINNISDVSLNAACVISNEVVDNFPVHQVVMEDELKEVFVNYDNGFVELLQPAGERLKSYLYQLNITLPRGYRTEINLQATEWMTGIGQALKKGFVVTIDYGFPAVELYSDKRRTGTLLCYHKHSINYDPYINIGEQDITTHINFSALHKWGLQKNLNLTGYTTQINFLLSLGLTNYLRELEKPDNDHSDSREKALMIHTFLMDMGSKFKVLIQHKGIPNPKLSGLQFSQHVI